METKYYSYKEQKMKTLNFFWSEINGNRLPKALHFQTLSNS